MTDTGATTSGKPCARWLLDRIATHILAFEGDSHVEFIEGNYSDYEADYKRRHGSEPQPTRIKYKPLKK